MKRTFAAAIVVILTTGSIASAQCGKDGGCGDCSKGASMNQAAPAGGTAGKADPYLQFRRDTLDLRQEMMNRRFDLQRENLKGSPDAARVAALKADVSAIQARINAIRVQSGLPESAKRDGECFKPDGGCGMQNGQGQGGCNGKPCWQK